MKTQQTQISLKKLFANFLLMIAVSGSLMFFGCSKTGLDPYDAFKKDNSGQTISDSSNVDNSGNNYGDNDEGKGSPKKP